MDKYEYKLKTEQMLELMDKGAYNKAAEVADTIDWKRVRNATMLTTVSDIYEKNADYKKSYEVLNIAYHRAEGSRKVIYRLCALALKTGNVDEAIDYYDDFKEVAPKDPNQHILRYQILRARRASVEQQIEALEAFKKAEYMEEWGYELAKLYQESGMTAECLEECDDLILWFSEGKYVYKAMELKMQYKQLTPSQQEKYDKRYEKLETTVALSEQADIQEESQIENQTEEIPSIVDYKEAQNKAIDAPVDEEASISSVAQEIDREEELLAAEEDATIQKLEQRGIASRMKLGDALQSLLNPGGSELEENAGEGETPEFESAIEEIESVIDLDLVKEVDAKEELFDQDLEELKVEPLPEEIVVGGVTEEDDVEEVVIEEKVTKSAKEDQVEGQMSIEDILMGWDEANDVSESVEEEEKDGVIEESTAEPILPPDIQRLIDEIEGVVPVEENELEKVHPVKQEEEVLPNKGKETEQLRIDELEEEEFEEELEDFEEEEFEEELEDFEEETFEEELEDFEEEEFEEELEDFEEEEFEEELEDFEEEEFEEELEDFEEEEFEEELEDFEEEEFEEELEDFEEETFEEELEEDFEEEELEETFELEYDDREIPDEEPEEMDILSATTPLSRKETAKMIATGKTAPLPIDEISNALSMSNTGFIVHGRYDLETQSGIGTRAGLTEEQKQLFSYFVPVRGMSEQLVDVLEQDRNCTNRNGTSNKGNLLIIGNKGNGKTVLAVDVVKAIQKQRNIRQGKVAIVTGDSLNKKRVSDIFDKLYGGALIIEKAGRLNEKTVARLNKAMDQDTGELLVVLEEQRKPLDRLLSSNREFRRKFTSRLEVPIFINDELVTFGQTYAQENGYRIDEMGILALYSRIDALQREDHAVTVAEVKEVMDEAMDYSQKASAKKLVKRVFGKNTDDSDRILLSEKDFNV